MVGFEPFKTIINEISAIVGEEDVSILDSVCYTYSFDTSLYSGKAIGVVKPESVDEICEILKIANKYKIPVVPRGFGTGNRGGAVPYNALVIDMLKFNYLNINSKNLIAEVESGVLFKDLKLELDKKNLFLPPEPDFYHCTIGGYVATSKSGKRTLKYGNIKDYVIGLEAVLPNGEFVELGSKNFKHSGIDFKDLFIGSEGVLGIITKVYCKVLPKPKESATIIVNTNLNLGVELAIEILNKILPSGIDYFDEECSKMLGLNGENILIELDSYSDLKEEIEIIKRLSEDYGKIKIYKSREAEKIRRMFNVISVKLKSNFEGFPVVEDFEVQITSIPFVVEEIKKTLSRNGIEHAVYCHIDSGVLHPILFIENIRNYESTLNELCNIIKKFGGYIAGEYGIGLVKSKFLDSKTLNILRSVKSVVDPNNIMNPCKMGL